MDFNAILDSRASTVGIIVLVLILMATGQLLPRTWFNGLLKAKDEIIESQAKIIEDNRDVKPLIVQLLEKLNEGVKEPHE